MPKHAPIFVIGEAVLDLDRGTLEKNAQLISVRPKSFALLKHLATNAGRVISKEELIEAVWARSIVTDDALTQTIKDVRRAIEDRDGVLLRAHPKRGYSLTISASHRAGFSQSGDVMGRDFEREDRDSVPTLAVLPFRALGDRPEWAHVAEGFANELTIALSRFRSLKVLASATSCRLAARDATSPSIGIDADFAVEVTMALSGDQIRFQLQMLDTRLGSTRWAESITIHQNELVGLEHDLAGKIAAALDHHASDAVFRGDVRRRGGAFEAFDCWLRGQHRLYHGDWTKEGEQEAIEWFYRALLVDETFARAHSSLALTLNVQPLVRPGLAFETERAKVLDHARKALAFDDADARSHLAMAWVSLVGQDRSRAERHFALAASLNPNAADVLINCALGAAKLGQQNKAAELAERAVLLNPTYPDIYDFFLAQIRLCARDYAGAVEIGTSVSTMTPAFPAWLAAAAALAGERSLADKLGQQFLSIASSRWEGPEPFSQSRAVRWFLSVTARASEQQWEELKKGLSLAGLASA